MSLSVKKKISRSQSNPAHSFPPFPGPAGRWVSLPAGWKGNGLLSLMKLRAFSLRYVMCCLFDCSISTCLSNRQIFVQAAERPSTWEQI